MGVWREGTEGGREGERVESVSERGWGTGEHQQNHLPTGHCLGGKNGFVYGSVSDANGQQLHQWGVGGSRFRYLRCGQLHCNPACHAVSLETWIDPNFGGGRSNCRRAAGVLATAVCPASGAWKSTSRSTVVHYSTTCAPAPTPLTVVLSNFFSSTKSGWLGKA